MCIIDRAMVDVLAVTVCKDPVTERTLKQVVEEFDCTFGQPWTIRDSCGSAVPGLLDIDDAALWIDVANAQCLTLAVGRIGNNSDKSLLDC
jgi:hypothetical protein